MGNMRKVPFLNGFDRYYKPEKQTYEFKKPVPDPATFSDKYIVTILVIEAQPNFSF